MRVSVIGCGSIGRRHIGNLLALGCQVSAWDVNQSAIPANVAAIPRHWTPSDYDAMVIATPWNQHLNYSIAAGSCGIPFFVEKPLGSLEELPQWRQMVEATQAQGLTTQVGYQLRFHPVYRAMRQMIPKPMWGSFRCDFDMSTWPGRAYGPPELEASHELDLALDCGLSKKHVMLNAGAARYFRDWHIASAPVRAGAQFYSVEELGDQMYMDEMAHFLECIREGKQTICPLRDGLRVLEALACQS